MTDVEVRRPKFDFTEDVPWEWNPQNPPFSFFMNATSMIAICFEQMIVAAVQEAKPLITDPEVAAEATAFLRQEAQHSSTHRKHVNALIKHYPGLQETFDAATASFDEVTATTPLEFRLAYVADLEATFTPFFKMLLDNEETLFRPGRRAGGVTVDVALRRGGRTPQFGTGDLRRGGRSEVVPDQSAAWIVKHLMAVMAIITDGVNAHVPLSDRKVDARTMLAGLRHARSLRAGCAGSARQASRHRFASVPRT